MSKYDHLAPDVIRLLSEGRSASSIAREMGLDPSTICRLANRHGQDTSRYLRRCDIRLDDHIDEIKSMYESTRNQAEVARHFGCSKAAICVLLKEEGVGRKFRYDFDHSFFSLIDTEAKAYTLGFFVADGCNQPNGVVSIEVTDLDILEKIKDSMGYTGPIPVRECNQRHPNRKSSHRLSLFSHRMRDDLTRLGCPPRKSFVTRFPTEEEVPKHLLRHYIRGVFDGDGSICRSRGNWFFSIVGTFDLLDPMRKFIAGEVGVRVGISRSKNIYIIQVGGNQKTRRILDWLYADATIYLDRKFARYQQVPTIGEKEFADAIQIG